MNKKEAARGLCAVLDYITSLKISLLEKFIVVGFVMAYILSPVDLIPDVPVVGWLDDIGVGALFIAFCSYRVGRLKSDDTKDDVIDVKPVNKPIIELESHEDLSPGPFFTFSQKNDTCSACGDVSRSKM